MAVTLEFRLKSVIIEILYADDGVEMSFVQSYKSDRISVVGKKILTWRNEGDRWKIVKEFWKSS
ncbi:MAG TPA: hypothetical protein HPP54_02930 [Nitrospinae bacterium]|nr:hypothetical protein [Nitrospinota bacterium]